MFSKQFQDLDTRKTYEKVEVLLYGAKKTTIMNINFIGPFLQFYESKNLLLFIFSPCFSPDLGLRHTNIVKLVCVFNGMLFHQLKFSTIDIAKEFHSFYISQLDKLSRFTTEPVCNLVDIKNRPIIASFPQSLSKGRIIPHPSKMTILRDNDKSELRILPEKGNEISISLSQVVFPSPRNEPLGKFLTKPDQYHLSFDIFNITKPQDVTTILLRSHPEMFEIILTIYILSIRSGIDFTKKNTNPEPPPTQTPNQKPNPKQNIKAEPKHNEIPHDDGILDVNLIKIEAITDEESDDGKRNTIKDATTPSPFKNVIQLSPSSLDPKRRAEIHRSMKLQHSPIESHLTKPKKRLTFLPDNPSSNGNYLNLSKELLDLETEIEKLPKPIPISIPKYDDVFKIQEQSDESKEAIIQSELQMACKKCTEISENLFNNFETFTEESTESIVQSLSDVNEGNFTIDFSQYYKFDDFPQFEVEEINHPHEVLTGTLATEIETLTNSLFAEFTPGKGLTMVGNCPTSEKLVLCVASMFLNGLRNPNETYDVLTMIEGLCYDASTFIDRILEKEKDTTKIWIQFAISLLNEGLTSIVARMVLKNDSWISKYFKRGAQILNYQEVEKIIFSLNLLHSKFQFSLHSFTLSSEDQMKYFTISAYAYLDVNYEDLKNGADICELLAEQLNSGLNPNMTAINFLLEVAMNGKPSEETEDWKNFVKDVVFYKAKTYFSSKSIYNILQNAVQKNTLLSWLTYIFGNRQIVSAYYQNHSSIQDYAKISYILSVVARFIKEKEQSENDPGEEKQ